MSKISIVPNITTGKNKFPRGYYRQSGGKKAIMVWPSEGNFSKTVASDSIQFNIFWWVIPGRRRQILKQAVDENVQDGKADVLDSGSGNDCKHSPTMMLMVVTLTALILYTVCKSVDPIRYSGAFDRPTRSRVQLFKFVLLFNDMETKFRMG